MTSYLVNALHLAELRRHLAMLAGISLVWLVAGWLLLPAGGVVLGLAFGAVLLVLAVFDYYYYYLYDTWVLLLAIIAVFTLVVVGRDIFVALGCALSAGGFMCLLRLFSRGGLGLGDVKLTAVLGLYLGYSDTVLALFIAFFAGGVVATVLLAAGRASRHTRLAFGPFLSLGALVTMLCGADIWRVYEALLC